MKHLTESKVQTGAQTFLDGHLRPIEAAYLYLGVDGSVMIYDIHKGTAIQAPLTWQMNGRESGPVVSAKINEAVRFPMLIRL